MKMENEIRSMIKGKIKNLEVQVNDSVEKDQILLTIEPIIDN
jgi:biotin carboxyl carrier protein